MQLIESWPNGKPREVELTPAEVEASAAMDDLLDQGLGIYDAADRVEQDHPGLDPAFYAYLRQ